MTVSGKIGIYMRLSRDDDKAGESTSIEHQRIILQKYVAERSGTIIDEYIDDGWSGTNFDRPAVKRLMEDAQSGRIDTIIVKDLSRFGRNYIQVGQYLDYIFPAYGIRFIAICDNVDTSDRCSTAMDMMPIMNVFNEWHAANTSKKIRSVLEASQRSGKYTNWNYPYGYRAGNDENRTAIIDGQAADVVRRIFELRAQGNSTRAIAKILTDEGIPNPATYYTRLDGGKWNRPCKMYWCPSTVRGILSNPVYIGNTVQHKTTSVSYKNHKVIHIPEGERIVKENAHEAIINIDLWNRVQATFKSVSRGRIDKFQRVHALSGLLVCADCGKKMKIKITPKNGRAYFYCRTYVELGKRYCSSHSIPEKLIEQTVLHDIQKMLSAVTVDEEKERQKFITKMSKSAERNRYSDERQLKVRMQRLAELDKLIQSAYEDKVLGNLPESVFFGLCERYQKEKVTLEEETEKLQNRIAKADNCEEVDEYIRRIREYSGCQTLTRETCLQLINFITVGEKNANGSREINIYYNLKDD